MTKFYLSESEDQIISNSSDEFEVFNFIYDTSDTGEEIEEKEQVSAKRKRGQSAGFDEDKMRKAIDSGRKASDIAEEFGVTAQTVYNFKSKIKNSATEAVKTFPKQEKGKKLEMIQEFGMTAVKQVLDMYTAGNREETIARAVALNLDDVIKIVEACVNKE